MPGTMIRTGLPFRPYVYRGTGVDELTPDLDTDDLFDPVDAPCWCGEDMRGYRRHLRHREDACQPSRDACNAYHRERARQKALSKCPGCGYSVTSQNHKTLCWRAS